MKSTRELEIVIGICERDGKLLLIQRQDRKPIWDKKWEFPGGKIDGKETPSEAIRREVLEETNLEVLSDAFFGTHSHAWELEDETLHVNIHCFYCRVGEGDVIIEPQKAYTHAWVSFQESFEYDCLKANKDILRTFSACKDIEHGLK